MSTTIAHSGGAFQPSAMPTLEMSAAANTRVHEVLNRASPDVTLRVAGLRRGTWQVTFDDEGAALAAFAVFRSPQVLTLTNTDVPAADMAFVVAEGEIRLVLDPSTKAFWTIDVPFREVAS